LLSTEPYEKCGVVAKLPNVVLLQGCLKYCCCLVILCLFLNVICFVRFVLVL
jgi:hypothetical protein